MKAGIATAARMPMMATTIMSSMRVKPFALALRNLFSIRLLLWRAARPGDLARCRVHARDAEPSPSHEREHRRTLSHSSPILDLAEVTFFGQLQCPFSAEAQKCSRPPGSKGAGRPPVLPVRRG